MRERSARKGVLPVAPRALILGEGAKVSGTGKNGGTYRLVLEGPSRRKESSSTTDDTQLHSRSAFTSNVISSPPFCPSNSHSTGTSAGAPLSLIKNARNLAGFELLAFRSTT